MNIEQLNIEIAKERACITDLQIAINLHMEEGDYDLAIMRHLDIRKSMEHIKKLETQRRFFVIAMDLARDGITARVVKRIAKNV